MSTLYRFYADLLSTSSGWWLAGGFKLWGELHAHEAVERISPHEVFVRDRRLAESFLQAARMFPGWDSRPIRVAIDDEETLLCTGPTCSLGRIFRGRVPRIRPKTPAPPTRSAVPKTQPEPPPPA